MSVQFDQINNFNKDFERTMVKNNNSKINAFLIKHHIAKDEKQANIILLALSVFFLVLTIVIFTYNNKPDKVKNNLSPEVMKALPVSVQ